MRCQNSPFLSKVTFSRVREEARYMANKDLNKLKLNLYLPRKFKNDRFQEGKKAYSVKN